MKDTQPSLWNSISETAASRKTRKFVVFGIQGDMQLKSLPFSPTEENITSAGIWDYYSIIVPAGMLFMVLKE
ncbi:Hypothetical predicted protein [Mytilus galloprovincialis]|uniref:Uncharacterized protein n=1 Tax=Mytilus galloprovincialis TaxID=29158 RepID=A0A8B6DMI4_MYTGA|nr:Hypothetical predicted protein [Mytilus galloprovincialis]